MRIALSFAASFAALCLASQATRAAVLDNYTDVQHVVRTGVGTTSTTMVAPGAIGGSRFAAVSVTGGIGTGEISINSTVANALTVNSDSEVDANFELVYGNAADLDANFAGSNAFILRVLNSDLGGSANSITITTTGGGTSTAAFTVPGNIGGAGGPASPFDIIVPFSALVGTASTSDVDKISLDFNSPRDADWAIQTFGTTVVPEPASLGALAPAGMLLARRRRA